MIKPFLLSIGVLFFSALSQGLSQRVPYDLPLPRLKVAIDDKDPAMYEKVTIIMPAISDQSVICRYSDFLVKIRERGQTKILYEERPELASYLSDFEAAQLNLVCTAFIKTLQQAEVNLRKNNWGKCLYLDSYLPHFMRGFHFLCAAAHNSPDALPATALVAEDQFDVSLNSPLSDERVAQWQRDQDCVIKLRIIINELILQLQTWQKKVLANPKRKRELTYDTRFKETFTLFVKIYFDQ